jgi:Hypothetical protein (DUF2513)
MKRDPDLIRKLLLYLEQKPNYKAELVPQIEGYTEDDIKYHCLLLAQAGYVDYEPEKSKTGRFIRVFVFGLSWQGHEFLEASRDEGIWRKGLSIVAGQSGGVAMDLLKAWLFHEAKRRLGLDLP